MHPIVRTLRAYASDAREAFRVAPVEVLLGVVVALTFSIHLRAEKLIPDESWARLMVAAWLSFTPLLALTALHMRGAVGRPARIAASVVVLLAAALYAVFVFDPEHEAEIWRFACLMLAGISFLLLTPAIQPRVGGRLAHWKFAFGVLARTAGVAAYAAVLFAALSGAVASVVNLFELAEPDHLYQDLAAWIFLAAAPWILVGGIGRLLEEAVRPAEGAPLPVVRFGRFVYAPILVVYLAILYAYAAKVLLTQELPKNLVSPLVLAAGLLGMAGALLLEPVHADREERGLSLLVRWVPALLLPLLPFAYLAILMRQGQYGWTEFRYLRLTGTVMLSVVAILGAVWLARRRMPPLASVPGILALGLFLVSVGPWSAQAVSRRDQQARLRASLRAAGIHVPLALRAPGGAAPRDSILVTDTQYAGIHEGIQYLYSAHGVEAVAAVLGPSAKQYDNGGALAAALPLRTVCRAAERGFEASLAPGAAVPVRAGRLIEFGSRAARTRDSTALVLVRPQGARLQVTYSGWSAGVDLAGLVSALSRQPTDSCEGSSAYTSGLRIPLESARFPLRDAAGQPRGELIVTELQASSVERGRGRVLTVGRASGYLLLY